MLRDPREGWEPNGILRQAHELAQEGDYKKCTTKEEREFKYEFYFVKAAKKLFRSRYSADYEYLAKMDDARIERELAYKEKLKNEAIVEVLDVDPDDIDEILEEDKERFYEPLGLNELSGISGQLE